MVKLCPANKALDEALAIATSGTWPCRIGPSTTSPAVPSSTVTRKPPKDARKLMTPLRSHAEVAATR
jgi:hypothetical protein